MDAETPAAEKRCSQCGDSLEGRTSYGGWCYHCWKWEKADYDD